MKSNRSRTGLIREIMKCIQENEGKDTKQSRIIECAKINHVIFKKYTDFLMSQGLVYGENKKGYLNYRLSPQGKDYLKKFETTFDILR